jgi:phosphoribosylaminoimidazole-succinocarboxamide synthase
MVDSVLPTEQIAPMADPNPVFETSLQGLTLWRKGKVRDVYEVGTDRLLMVATDRLSAFDVVLPTPIPDKGAVLNQISLFWFRHLEDVVPNHVVSGSPEDEPGHASDRETLAGRSMLVQRTEPVAAECIVRGYLAGSGWKEYQATGKVCGIALPSGLKESDRLPEPIFTPSTKAETGHDQNISFAELAKIVGDDRAAELRDLSLRIYARAAQHAETRGIIIADTKFEFGERNGRLVWIDEALTPDSSRFWPQDTYRPGASQPSFDKQYVRDWLETLTWDKRPPGPSLPADVVARTREKYLDAYARVVGGTPRGVQAPRPHAS